MSSDNFRPREHPKSLGGFPGSPPPSALRDPARNAAIIYALIAGLCALSVTPLVSLYTLDVGQVYPSYFFWGRTLIRLGLAGVLLYLRPCVSSDAQPAN